MKKLIGATAAAMLVFGAAASAEITEAVYSTDIGALIDGCPIKSYNISDSTYIKAEDLRGYGFDVAWDAYARTLKITPDDSSIRTIPPVSEINIKKSDIPYNKKLYDVYSTDIKTYINGSEVHACNIDGETLIKLRDLERLAYVNYDDDKRLASIDVIAKRLDDEYDSAADMADLTLGEGITYNGQVKDGKPDGIGRITDKSRNEYRINDTVTTAHFSGGEISGIYRIDGTYNEISGSSRGIYIRRETGNTNVHYKVEYSNYHIDNLNLYCGISTIDYDNLPNATGTECRTLTDNNYLYGIKNTSMYGYSTLTDGDWNIEPESDLPKFDHFTGDYGAFAITDGGKMYTLPYGPDYTHPVSPLAQMPEGDKNITGGSYSGGYSDSNWLLDTDGRLYGFYWDIEAGNFASTVIAENVKSARAPYIYLDNNGTLYEDMHDGNAPRVVDTDVKMFDGTSYVIYLKNDGSVWAYRSNSRKELGQSWNDEKDLSSPVKCGDDAMWVSSGNGLAMSYVKNDGSVYVFGASYNGEKGFVENNDGGIDYNKFLNDEGVKMGEGFVSCKMSSSVVLALTENGDLYAWGGENKAGVIDKDGGENILVPTKVAENVQDYIYDGALYIIKTDGTLWYRGKTRRFSESYSDNSISDFTLCDSVYRKA